MKKLICLIMTSILIFSSFSGMVLAEEVSSSIYTKTQIEELVRSQLQIGEEIKLDNAYLNTRDTRLQNLWHLSFSGEDGGIHVSITAETGEIINYNKWESTSYARPITLLPEKAKEKAIAFIQSLEAEKFKETKEVSAEAPSMIILDLQRNHYHDNNYYFMFVRKMDGEFFPNNHFRVQVSGATGNVTQYEMSWDEATYQSQQPFISEGEARAAFEKEDRFALKYRALYTNNQNQEREKPLLTPVYIYTPKESDKINAIDGRLYKREDIYSPWGNYYMPRYAAGMGDIAVEEAMAYDRGEVIPEEGVISKERVERQVLQTVKGHLDIEDLRVESSSYSNYYFGFRGKYWSIYWRDQRTHKSLQATVDAENGNILAVNYRKHPREIEIPPEAYRLDVMPAEAVDRETRASEAAVKIDEAKIKKEIAGKISAMFPKTKEQEIKLEVDSVNPEESLVSLRTVRYIDDIPYEDNYIYISYQYNTGEIMALDYRWQEVEAQSAASIRDKKAIAKKFYDTVGFERYLVQLKDKAAAERDGLDIPLKELVPVYSIKSFGFSYIDGITGKLLDHHGDEYQESPLHLSEFQDIRNHPYENEIIFMSRMGFLKEDGNNFFPNHDLLRKDAIKWIVEMGWRNNQRERIQADFRDIDEDNPYYEYIQAAVERGILDKNQGDFRPDEKVSKIEVTKWIINAMEQKELAQFTEIFQVPYSDREAIATEDIGYAALAKYHNIYGDKKGEGTFEPDKVLKRGEFVSTLYHLLVNQ